MRYALSVLAVGAWLYWFWRYTPIRRDFNPDAMSDEWMNQRGYR